MAIRRITISVPEELAERIKQAAGDKPVSQYVTETLEKELSDDELQRQWEEFYRSLPPNPEADMKAAEMFERLVGSRQYGGEVA
jgi:hypothetical protein